jgi:hypothetical protein
VLSLSPLPPSLVCASSFGKVFAHTGAFCEKNGLNGPCESETFSPFANVAQFISNSRTEVDAEDKLQAVHIAGACAPNKSLIYFISLHTHSHTLT